jgi:hypothetical protein
MVGTNPTVFLVLKAWSRHSLYSLIAVKTGMGYGERSEIGLWSTGNIVLVGKRRMKMHERLNRACGRIDLKRLNTLSLGVNAQPSRNKP